MKINISSCTSSEIALINSYNEYVENFKHAINELENIRCGAETERKALSEIEKAYSNLAFQEQQILLRKRIIEDRIKLYRTQQSTSENYQRAYNEAKIALNSCYEQYYDVDKELEGLKILKQNEEQSLLFKKAKCREEDEMIETLEMSFIDKISVLHGKLKNLESVFNLDFNSKQLEYCVKDTMEGKMRVREMLASIIEIFSFIEMIDVAENE